MNRREFLSFGTAGLLGLGLRAAPGEKRFKYAHTGIVVQAGPDTFKTIEGNTNDDGSAEGYEVCARVRGYTGIDFIVT